MSFSDLFDSDLPKETKATLIVDHTADGAVTRRKEFYQINRLEILAEYQRNFREPN
jgi:hypothetical protein